MSKMVKVELRSSYGYQEPGQKRKYYGPGEVSIPEGLARTLGVDPLPKDADDLDAQQPVVSNEGETALPDDFPGKAHLEKAGYGTMDAVRNLDFDELVLINGIGPATARAIILAVGDPDEL